MTPTRTTFAALIPALILTLLPGCAAQLGGGEGDYDVDDPNALIDDGGPYPIVLAHGLVGFEDFAGTDFITYFYGVKDRLAREGEVEVFTPAVDPFNTSTVRGEQLLAHVERIIEQTGASRVNLIGHSQGGLDARYVAHMRPDLVASVTTISTPHRGSEVADLVQGAIWDDRMGQVVDSVVRLIAAPLYDADGEATSAMASLDQLSSEGAAEFNERITDAPGVAYYSIAGRTAYHRGGDACRVSGSPEFISQYNGARDPVDPLLLVTEEIVDGGLFSSRPNDGLVSVESARWGTFLGCIPADHIDEIGHFFGDWPGLFNPFRHQVFYSDLVHFLREEGY